MGAVALRESVREPDADRVRVDVRVIVSDAVALREAVRTRVPDCVAEMDGVRDRVCDRENVALADVVDVRGGVRDAVALGVAVRVAVGGRVAVADGLRDAVGVTVQVLQGRVWTVGGHGGWPGGADVRTVLLRTCTRPHEQTAGYHSDHSFMTQPVQSALIVCSKKATSRYAANDSFMKERRPGGGSLLMDAMLLYWVT